MAKAKKLVPGDRAPDGVAKDANENDISLSAFWADGPILLTFLRHFG